MSKVNSILKKINRSSSLFLAGLFSLSLLSGCSYLAPYKAPLTQGNIMTQESVNLLQEGLTKGQVRELLGPPMGQDTFNPKHWDYLYYTTAENSETKILAKHLVINFDNDDLLDSWKTSNDNVQLKKDNSWLGLGWF
ncbi:outer membrane protein assembly factor BamE [Thiomicrorhabdus sp. Milos-T2]|uniref:outer membrane protein assembly factor BamE n=1 Tax=Thiomicrorhabdus sp. Milos-T2 TaxID=90814 RepID=UPI001F47B747|nr:outer membrane protein assembly factor BamE [Thiomicrorhabdus sp. Milos-T2]